MKHSILSRIKTLKSLLNYHPQEESGIIKAGQLGEAKLFQNIKDYTYYKESHLFRNKRVPDLLGRGRKEIDLLIITHNRIHLIEIKNWTGRLVKRGQEWIQVRNNGTTQSHPNLAQLNQYKQSVLRKYLEEQGLKLNPLFFSQKIIFMNSNLKIDRKIRKNKDVIPYSKLEYYLKQQVDRSLTEKVSSFLIDYCLKRDLAENLVDALFNSLTPGKYTELINIIHNLKTWDTLYYYGEKTQIGDLIRIKTSFQIITPSEVKDVDLITLKWTRSAFYGFLKLFFYELGSLIIPNASPIPLCSEDFVEFHCPGHSRPTRIPLFHLESISLGHAQKKPSTNKTRYLLFTSILLICVTIWRYITC
jgi:hypothetical protein